MFLPGIIDGLSVVNAFKQSIRLGITYFDRVFSIWISFMVILLAMMIPLMAGGLFIGSGVMLPLLGIYALPVSIFAVFIFFPAVVIALSRIYLILTGIEVHDEPEDDGFPDVSMVGGV
jgi:hypothetical protein